MTHTASSTDFAGRATAYARRVVAREVVASKWVRLACERHLRDLERGGRWSYDAGRADKVCRFAEVLKHEKGVLQGQRFRLEDAQVFLFAMLFGWVDARGTRKYRQAIVMLPRGNGKSPIAAIIGLWMAFFDGEPGAEVYCGANKEKQAFEVFRPARAMVEQSPELATKFGIKVAAKSIFQPGSRSRFQPVVRKPGDGASIYLGILDELHEAQDATLYDTFVTGLNKRVNSLLLVISTAGVSSTENPCLQLQEKGQKVLEGVIDDDRLFVLIHSADADVDWTSVEAVEMAQPMLGISNDREAILLDQQEAIRSPAKANVFKAKVLNLWSSVSEAWMSMPAWDACRDETLTVERVKHLPCWIGSDLASKLDLSACVRVWRDDSQGAKPHYYALCRAYLPEERVNAPENQHYQSWSADGLLTATDGSSIDYAVMEADACADIAKLQVKELPYDPRYADQWSQRVSELSGVTRVEMPPNPATLSPPMKELEAAVYDGRFHHDGNPLLKWCMSNILTRETAAGNYTMPDKVRSESKIDAAIALFLAMGRAMLGKPVSTAIRYRGLRSV